MRHIDTRALDSRRAANRRSHAKHRDERNEKIEHRRQERADWLKVYKQSRGCAECGFWHAEALDLHHIDPSTKLYDAQTLIAIAKQKMVDEVAKCIVLCANCHRMRHATS